MFLLGKARQRNFFQVIRKHAPQRVILRLNFKFCPQYDPYTSAAGSRLLLEESDTYSLWYHHIFSRAAGYSFLQQPFPLASICEMERQSTLLSKALLDTQEEDKINV